MSDSFDVTVAIIKDGAAVSGTPVFNNTVATDPVPSADPDEPEETYKLVYHVVGDDVYGTPSDSRTPSYVDGIKTGGSVDPLAKGPSTNWITSDGTPDGIPGLSVNGICQSNK